MRDYYDQKIICKYHGRVFDLKGRFLSAPGFEEAKLFPSKIDNLNKIKIRTWKKLIFVSIKPEINIEKIFNDIELRLGWYPFNELRYNKSNTVHY